MHNDIEKVLISEEELDKKTSELAERISKETGMNVKVADNPLDCVAHGTAKRLETGHGFDNYVFRRNKNYR